MGHHVIISVFVLMIGVKVMFRIALVLIKMTLSGGDKLAECTSFYETLEKLRNIPMDAFDEETLAREVRLLVCVNVNIISAYFEVYYPVFILSQLACVATLQASMHVYRCFMYI